jgi:hypothetical protein
MRHYLALAWRIVPLHRALDSDAPDPLTQRRPTGLLEEVLLRMWIRPKDMLQALRGPEPLNPVPPAEPKPPAPPGVAAGAVP